jgi:ribosomal protein S18 acetylase RimI-like enzyme
VAVTFRDEIVRLETARYALARRALARAFFDYNLMVYATADDRRRAGGVDTLYSAILWDCFRWGEVYVTPDVVGSACWLPPEKAYSTFVRQARAGMLMLPLRFGLRGFRRLLAYDAVGQRLHHSYAHEPHWYLAAIGVEPEHQGRGIGGALMQPILARADSAHLDCYLETHRESNVRLYQKHGFDICEQATVPGHPIPLWAMKRRPR